MPPPALRGTPTSLLKAVRIDFLGHMKIRSRVIAVLLALVAGGAGRAEVPARGTLTRNVVLVTIDGLRWQEVFRGAEAELMTPEAGRVDGVGRKALLARFAGTKDRLRTAGPTQEAA